MTKKEKKELNEVLHAMCTKFCDKPTEAWILTQNFEEGIDFLNENSCANCPLKRFIEERK